MSDKTQSDERVEQDELRDLDVSAKEAEDVRGGGKKGFWDLLVSNYSKS